MKCQLYYFLALMLLLELGSSYSCADAANANQINNWGQCYESRHGQILHSSKGSMTTDYSCHNNNCWSFTWDYNYKNNIAFTNGGSLAVQYWSYWTERCSWDSDCSSYHCINVGYNGWYDCTRYALYSGFNTPTLMVPCHQLCSSCTAKWSATSCQSCYSTAALMMSYSTCINTFSSSEGSCWADNQCLVSCPTTFYFKLDISLTNTIAYPFTYSNSALQTSHFCYLCYFTCKTCSNRYDTTCSSCINTYYKWQQSRTVCSYYCPQGTYITVNAGSQVAYRGQYKLNSRQCAVCDTGCQFCANSPSECYVCQNDYFLIDDLSTCTSTFKNNAAACSDCSSISNTLGCSSRNNQCRSTCPDYFYFKVTRLNTSGNSYDGSTNPLYDFFTNAAGVNTALNGYQLGTDRQTSSTYKSPQGANSNYLYRRYTNYCKLCHNLCMKCFGPSEIHCTQCITTAALIMNKVQCDGTFSSSQGTCYVNNQCITTCPTTFYFRLPKSSTNSALYPFTSSGTSDPILQLSNICYLCYSTCKTCSDRYDTTCSSCINTYYKWQQSRTVCSYYCPQGTYITVNAGSQVAYRGQYKLNSRQCAVCDTGCQFCANSPSECYVCQNNYFLIDDLSACTSTFKNNAAACSDCSSISNTLGCSSRNNQCRSTCPDYFYFKVTRLNTSGNSYDGSTNPLYDFFTNAVGVNTALNGYQLGTSRQTSSTYKSPQGANSNYLYRRYTNYCKLCHNLCMKCFGPSEIHCTQCITTAALIMNKVQCNDTFSSLDGTCYVNYQCITTCPTTFYFRLPKSSTNSALYPFTSSGTSDPILKLSNICYLCHRFCKVCTDNTNDKCTECAQTYFNWVQNRDICHYYCNQGDFNTTAGHFYLGQFVPPGLFICETCATGCQLCKTTAYTCYRCQDTHYLIDDKQQCEVRFKNNTDCPECMLISSSQGCWVNNTYCMDTCPPYFYFPVNRSAYLGNDYGLSTDSIYQFFTKNVSINTGTFNGYQYNTVRYNYASNDKSPLPNPTDYYRSQTNFCRLCDKRCMKCFGPTNANCTLCTNKNYKWTNAYVCQSYCPTGQYKLDIQIGVSYPINQTNCGNCNPFCNACVGYIDNCTSCKPYDDTNPTNRSYLYTYYKSNSTCMAVCPASTNTLTQKGYYGSIASMVCYPCPDQCSNCHIQIVLNDYTNLNSLTCTYDQLCSKAILCTSCLQGYSLVSNKCIDQNTCRLYSYYDKGNSSSSWSPTNCKCIKGYYMSSTISCSVCDLSCLTCNGPSSTNCLSCPDGYKLVSNTCSQYNTGSQIYSEKTWSSSQTFDSNIASSNTGDKKFCGSYQTLFGYKSSALPGGATFSYKTGAIASLKYYGIGFRLKILFIDTWDTSAAILFSLSKGVAASTGPGYVYNYNNYSAIGEQLCGTNIFDYIMTVDGSLEAIPSVLNENYTIAVSSNVNAIKVAGDSYKYYWGIIQARFFILQCHDDCASCTGPLPTQCTSCSDSMKRLKNGKCICNTDQNYYYMLNSDTQCQYGCSNLTCTASSTTCYYRDNVTATCVNPPYANCSAPNLYGNATDFTNSYGTCVQNCTGGTYILYKLMKCVSSCTPYGLFNYQASNTSSGIYMWTCVNKCPKGWIADPSTSNCVVICPSGYFWSLVNKTTAPQCVTNCTTGYEYDNTRQCVQSCPSGYYTQTISGHKKCVSTCQLGQFGDNVTLSCVDFCPTPSIADPTMSLCVNTCPANYAFQIKQSDGSRICVTGCESGQWMNIYYMNCSKNPMDCPQGTFADNTTNKCQMKCKTANEVGENSTRMCRTSCLTGYAYWDAGLCVSTCNNSMYGRIYNNSRECVFACDTNNTRMFADIQASRTCVKTCSSSPKATFGDNSTGQCVQKCTISDQFGDPFHQNRLCVTQCTSFPTQSFSYIITKLCVLVCPKSYYGDNYTLSGVGVCSSRCPSGYYGDPTTNLCVSRCPFRYYGVPYDPRPCVDTCPFGYYSTNLTTNRVCTTVCDTGLWADNYTRACVNLKTLCSNYTFADSIKKLCVAGSNCTAGTFADPFTMGCQNQCSNNTYFGDPSTNLCVTLCPSNPDYYSQAGKCTPTCTGNYFADWQVNRTCLVKCTSKPLALYGTSSFRCVKASQCGAGLFGNNNTQLCSSCNGTLPFGDPIIYQCVRNCSITYYGDYNTALCVLTCNFTIGQYADNFTGTCTKLCTNGTYGVNISSGPQCIYSCPANSYALQSNRICMDNCGTGFFGDPITGKCYSSPFNCSAGYFGNTVSNMCVQPQYCQTVNTLHYYADNATKICIPKCTSPNYGLNTTWYCIAQKCPNPYFAENTTRMCLVTTGCGQFKSFSDSQLNVCVSQCSTLPVFTFSENITFTCVIPKNCPSSMFAENTTQSCVYYCPYNATGLVNTTYLSYSDSFKTNRCVSKCPDLYYGDNSTGYGQCLSTCPGLNFFRDNITQICVFICPKANTTLGIFDTYGDNTTDMCVTKCPFGYFAQVQINRTCVKVCMAGTWGNEVTRMCINKPIIDCPSGTWADNFTNLCTSVCSSNSSNSQMFYGQNNTKLCVYTCPIPSMAYIPTRVCIDICPVTTDNSPGLFGDPSTSPTRLCVAVCLTTGLYRDVANNRTCQPICTFNSSYKTYRDPTSMTCVAECPTYPQYLYAWGVNSTTAECVSSCPTGYMNDANMSCVVSCPNLLDPTTNKCVSQCPYNTINDTILYADTTSKKCVSASNCPNNTYASDDLLTCVSSCPNGSYIYLKNCVFMCPDGLYISPDGLNCVTAKNCANNTFGNNQTRTCVSTCTNGTYADNNTKTCITQCYGFNYGDPNTKLCSPNCSTGLIKNDIMLVCVGSCSPGYFYNPLTLNCSTSCSSPYYADSNKSACVITCSSDPITFTSVTPVRACVTSCPASAAWFDLINRACTSTCPNGTYQYSLNNSCIAFCPKPYYRLTISCVLNCSQGSLYADELTRTCISSCPQGYFKDPTTFKCVVSCPINPVRHYSLTVGTSRTCQTKCPNNTYADNEVGSCAAKCSVSPVTYGEPNTWKCVSTCPASYSQYADPTTQKCVTICPSNYFADNRQRMCLKNCSNIYFADSFTNPPSCVSMCSDNTFADPLIFICSTNCSAGYFAYQPNRTCLQFCPFGYFSDISSGYCQQQCSNSPNLFADDLTHICSSRCSANQYSHIAPNTNYGICLNFCPNTFFSDLITKSCVTKCPNGYYGSTVNNTCNIDCQENLFKDSTNNLCQSTCPSANNLFGQPFSRKCVLNCSANYNTLLFADPNTRKCVSVCSGGLFGNPLTRVCVSISSCTGGLLADPKYSLCVQKCYSKSYSSGGRCWQICPNDLFADQETQSCVIANACSFGLFGDPTKGQCVKYCDINSTRFADSSSRTCLINCTNPYFADNITRTCNKNCSSIPQYYGLNDTRVCVKYCPPFTFGDPALNLCVSKCTDGYFGQNNTWTCIPNCPTGTFADNTTNKCVWTCPSQYFGDKLTGICVKKCQNGLFADASNNRQCSSTCLDMQFSENSTNQCRTACLTGFADPISRKCIATCPSGYYGHSNVCYFYQCQQVAVSIFADDLTNLCVTECSNGTYAQISSRKCVNICPISLGQFADKENKICVSTCQSGYADPSTRSCVSKCPQVPSFFGEDTICVPNCSGGRYADKKSRTCLYGCPNNTFADNSTYTCVSQCPTKPFMFAESGSNKCVFYCSQDYLLFADNSTRSCVKNCPNGTFADPVTFTCVVTCPLGYFGTISTKKCQKVCASPLLADHLIRLCVTRCSINPIYYGDQINHFCVTKCPSGSYGNPLTQECEYNSITNSTCPEGYFADNITQTCVLVCPMKSNLYANPLNKKCQPTCPQTYYLDNSTMRCVKICPSYPNYFADNISKKCVKYCPSGSYADNSTRFCVNTCPNGTFSDNSTWRCVINCVGSPKSFRDPNTSKCVSVCPPGTFADSFKLQCVAICPPEGTGFARNDTRQCVKTCPLGTYAYLQTRSCVTKCFNSTFADNSTRQCVPICPRSPPLFSNIQSMECVPLCDIGYYSFDPTRECLQNCPMQGYYRQNSSRSCVKSCNITQKTYTDNLTGFCVFRCSPESYADPTTMKCASICPDQPLMYAENLTQSCLKECPDDLYGQNKTRSCVKSCPSGSLSLPSLHLCVFSCPITFFAYKPTQFCLKKCPDPYYADPSTRSCVQSCPINQLLFADNSSRECVQTCPPGSYAYQWSITCLSSCPKAQLPFVQTYAADYDNTCTVQCDYPYYSDDANLRCVSSCVDPFFNNLQNHRCQSCPDECTSCSALNACRACINGYFLQDGTCVEKCRPLYFANSATRRCGISVLCKPSFGVNQTRICDSSCALGTFANVNAYRCDACPRTCSSCTSLTNCLSCNSDTVQSNNYCYSYCNYQAILNYAILINTNQNLNIQKPAYQYFSTDNKTCINQCPAGSFSSIVFCKTCSQSCGNCSGTRNNCTSCPKGFYLHLGKCVTSCPSQYKPISSGVCTFCGASCGQGLTYTTNVTNIDGQTSIFMNFNNQVNINGNLYQTFGISSSNRLLQQSAPAYQIVIIDANTVQIVFPPGSSQTNYNVNILNPQNVYDADGNLPSSLSSSVKVDLSEIYTTAISDSKNGFPVYFTFLGIICVISLYFDVQLMRFLQLIYVHYFVIMALPPKLSNVFEGLRFSTLHYLPRLFSIQDAVLRPKVPSYIYNSVGDYNFLRNAGFAFTPLVALLSIWGGLKLLSMEKVNRFKKARLWCQYLLASKFRYAILLQWTNIFILNMVFFAFLQLRDYTIYDSYAEAGLVFAHLILVLAVVLSVLIAYRVIRFHYSYPKLANKIKKAAKIIQISNSEAQASGHVFLAESKNVDLRDIQYPRINGENIYPFRVNMRLNLMSLLSPNVIYLRGFILSGIIAFSKSTVIQMSLALPLNLLSLYYFSKSRPYTLSLKGYKIKNYIVIYHQACIILLQFFLLAFGLKTDGGATSQQKQSYSIIVMGFLTAVCTVSLIYHLGIIWLQLYRKVWLAFLETQLFRKNFPEKYEQYQREKGKGAKIVRSIDPKAKQALKNMIRGYKKIRSYLRPTQQDKAHPKLPIKYKLSYFDRPESQASSKTQTTLTKAQRKKMLSQIFNEKDFQKVSRQEDQFEEIRKQSQTDVQFQYQEYEEQIIVQIKDLQKYVKNGKQLLRMKQTDNLPQS